MRYEPRFRPPQPETPPRDAFRIHRSVVRDGVALAYLREGQGGFPLLLLHGYPETKRIWWRNVRPLAAAGFEVIAPDLRGYGDSDLSPGDAYDLAIYSRDVHALVHDVLGHARCAVAAGDVGGAVAIDLLHRFPGFVAKLCFFDTRAAARARRVRGGGPRLRLAERARARPDRRLPRVAGREARRARGAARDAGGAPAVGGGDVHEPALGLARHVQRRRRGLHDGALRRRGAAARGLGRLPARARPPDERAAAAARPGRDARRCCSTAPTTTWSARTSSPFCERAFPNRIGPLVIPGAGHFLPWERADIFNPLLAAVFGEGPAAR